MARRARPSAGAKAIAPKSRAASTSAESVAASVWPKGRPTPTATVPSRRGWRPMGSAGERRAGVETPSGRRQQRQRLPPRRGRGPARLARDRRSGGARSAPLSTRRQRRRMPSGRRRGRGAAHGEVKADAVGRDQAKVGVDGVEMKSAAAVDDHRCLGREPRWPMPSAATAVRGVPRPAASRPSTSVGSRPASGGARIAGRMSTMPASASAAGEGCSGCGGEAADLDRAAGRHFDDAVAETARGIADRRGACRRKAARPAAGARAARRRFPWARRWSGRRCGGTGGSWRDSYQIAAAGASSGRVGGSAGVSWQLWPRESRRHSHLLILAHAESKSVSITYGGELKAGCPRARA